MKNETLKLPAGMKTILIESNRDDNNELLRIVGVKRIRAGWYRCFYNGVVLSRSTIATAEFAGRSFPDSSVSSV